MLSGHTLVIAPLSTLTFMSSLLLCSALICPSYFESFCLGFLPLLTVVHCGTVVSLLVWSSRLLVVSAWVGFERVLRFPRLPKLPMQPPRLIDSMFPA